MATNTRELLMTSPRFAIVSGLFLTGGANILFGCMEHSPSGNVFFALCCCIRFVEGAGFAAYLTSALATVIKTFPTRPGYYVGLTETVVTIAMISGPPLGSFLYTVGGYSLPFVTMGTIILMTCIVSSSVVVDDKVTFMDRRKSHGLTMNEFWHLLRLAGGSAAVACVTCNVTADSFVLISLSDHLSQFKLCPMAVGGVYLCLFLSYGLSSPVAGRLADKAGKEFLLQSCGCLTVTLAFALIGPASFIPTKPSVAMIVCGLLLKGIGAGPLISCSFSAALRAARNSGFTDDFRTYSLVSTLVSFSIPLGNLIGGLTTGILCEKLHMATATTIYVGVFLGLALFCFILHLHECWPFDCLERIKVLCKKVSSAEDTPLLRSPLNEPAIAMQPLRAYAKPKKERTHPILAFMDGQRIVGEQSNRSTYGLNDTDIAAILATGSPPSSRQHQLWF